MTQRRQHVALEPTIVLLVLRIGDGGTGVSPVQAGEDARLSIAAKMRADQFLTSENCIRKRLLENVPPAIPTSNVLGSFDFARLSPRFAQDDCFGGVTLVVKVDYNGLRG